MNIRGAALIKQVFEKEERMPGFTESLPEPLASGHRTQYF
jgi:hypothetical protein